VRVLRNLLLILAIAYSAFGQNYTIDTIAGGGLPINIGSGSASIGRVSGVAVDKYGDLYVALLDYNVVVRKGISTGSVTLVAGNGTPGYSGDNGPAINAQLFNPTSIAVDGAGNVYVADSGNACVRKISAGTITTVAGTGFPGYGGDGGPATNAQLNPVAGSEYGLGLTVDSNGNLYIADTGNYRVREVSGGVITTAVGNGTFGYGGDNGAPTSAQLAFPQSVAADANGNLYIADGNRIREVSAGIIATVAGSTFAGSSGNGGLAVNAELSGPAAIAVDANGNLFIADTGNNVVREVTNGVIGTIVGDGTVGFSGDGGPATLAELSNLFGIAVDPYGDLFIADSGNSRVRLVSAGIVQTLVGGGSSVGDKGLATSAQLLNALGLAVDSTGDVYIADVGNSRVREVASFDMTSVAGNGIPGFSGDTVRAANAQVDTPGGVALDSHGNIYIADSGNNRVREIANGVITTIAGSGTPGYSGDNGPATSAQLSNPQGVAVDSAGNLYIADSGNYRIRKVSGGVITTVAGNGTKGFAGDNGPATSAELSTVEGVAVDAAGNLYIADSLNYRVRVVAGGAITTVAGGGVALPGNNGLATSAQLGTAEGVAVDSSGNLFVTDLASSSIHKVSGGIITTLAGTGTGGFSGDGASSVYAQLDAPTGLAVDASNNVYVSDSGNQRIRALFTGGNGCTYAVSPSSFASVTASGGTLMATIQTTPGCHWAVQSLPPWIAYSGNVSGAGTATIALIAAADSDVARAGIVSIAGVPVLVSQAGQVTPPPPPPPPTAPSINSGGILNAASYTAPIAPGSIAAAYGDFLLTSAAVETQSQLPTSISGLSLQFGSGTPVPLFYVSGNQVNFQVPWELTGQSHASLAATLSGQTGPAQLVSVAPVAPAIFSQNSQGSGQGSILSSSYVLVDASNPALAGTTYILIYCTGLGAVTNQPADGSPPPISGIPLSYTKATPMVTIGGVPVIPVFSGLAPGWPGLYQVNALVPAGSTIGDAVPVTISIGGATSNTVTIAVQ
jgi:uncharacterized protein (TIGR03437 family)